MKRAAVRVLVIEGNRRDAEFISESLRKPDGGSFETVWISRLAEGLEGLAKGGVDVVLVGLSLPDSSGLETLFKIQSHAPDVPIVVLTGVDDETLAIQAVQAGAQDYLVKEEAKGKLLQRSLRYAIDRHCLLAELREMSLTDEVTGLYNRRGFFTLAGQQLKLAHRGKKELTLLYIDVDGLQRINDIGGHREGDQVLVEVGEFLKETFRESDIVARLGGDEFGVLAVDSGASMSELLILRLQARHAKEDRRYKLSLSIGTANYDAAESCSIKNLLSRAEKAMYAEKQLKKG